jgi:hypothetical protein
MGRACRTKREKRNACRFLVGKPEGKRPLGRPKHGRVDNIKMDFTDIGWGDINWIDLAQDRDPVNTAMNIQSGSIKCWEILEQLHNWRVLKKDSDMPNRV